MINSMFQQSSNITLPTWCGGSQEAAVKVTVEERRRRRVEMEEDMVVVACCWQVTAVCWWQDWPLATRDEPYCGDWRVESRVGTRLGQVNTLFTFTSLLWVRIVATNNNTCHLTPSTYQHTRTRCWSWCCRFTLKSDSIASVSNDDESQSFNIAVGNLTANFRFCPR